VRRFSRGSVHRINAGGSHKGVELLNYYQLIKPNLGLTTFLSGAVNHFRFKDFVDDANDYSK
jgi:iron complex outermembrane receptor protein